MRAGALYRAIAAPHGTQRGPRPYRYRTCICKSRGITGIFTSLSLATDHVTESDRGVSSLMDSWIWRTDVESSGERNRVLHVLKSRGMNHSSEVREYLLSDHGIHLIEP